MWGEKMRLWKWSGAVGEVAGTSRIAAFWNPRDLEASTLLLHE
jgi:hypothetical protein